VPESVISAQNRARWHGDGWCMLDGVFTGHELTTGHQAARRLFPSPEQVAAGTASPNGNTYDVSWDASKPRFPFAEGALNRLVVHDRLIDLAVDLLEVERVQLYQGLASAKYSSGSDYEQLLHVDYGNHTIVVPRAEPGFQHLELFVYLDDVDEDTAATRMVSRRLTENIPVERTHLAIDEYADLYAAEVPATGRAGSVLAYRPDTYHRGTSLLRPNRVRLLLHVAYKPIGTDWLGFQTWPVEAESLSWYRFVAKATLRQLVAVGFPEPGHPYWNAETLRGVAARYPILDMGPWERALESSPAEQAGGR
jgi:hypothetical protein